ncbi:Toxin YhaV [Jannaschia donghaensis]|uniref:Toxin YhaV n=1 Tax=Jannaschia donghaensis TaxID=420998 RepID=A0A0M6YQM0_9RHOB|nr:Toxin YhaV [Jannaschia donghaensis]
MVNDKKTLRKYGSKTDAYATFRGMLDGGNPPDNFDAPMKEAVRAADRFGKRLKSTPDH